MYDDIDKDVPISTLTNALEQAWSAETSTDAENWSEDDPAYGQCATTACVVQDYLGGDILNAYVDIPEEEEDVSHYFNDIDGTIIDVTARQFPDDASVPIGQPKPKDFETTRDYVLSYEETEERYERLKDEVEEALDAL